MASVDEDGVLEVVSREKSPVRLGSHTLASRRLSPEAVEAGVSVIEQFQRSIEAQEATLARAVATCAVREAENSQEFLDAARRRTGIEVDVVSGEEEARLIHLAARSEFSSRLDPALPARHRRRLDGVRRLQRLAGSPDREPAARRRSPGRRSFATTRRASRDRKAVKEAIRAVAGGGGGRAQERDSRPASDRPARSSPSRSSTRRRSWGASRSRRGTGP